MALGRRDRGPPAPEAFLLDRRTSGCGLIDWAGALRGPLLYDLASAQMYLGGPGRAEPLLEAYTASGVLPVAEIQEHLDLFARFRWAVQADYFAWRIRTDYRVGQVDPLDNVGGLADAAEFCRALEGSYLTPQMSRNLTATPCGARTSLLRCRGT